jgi:putative nucleotidyltransferase with HDIG domain
MAVNMKAKYTLKDSEMVPVQRRELKESLSFPADIFLRMKEGTYILVTRQGDKANLDELHVLEEDGIDYLYVRLSDYKNIVGQSLVTATLILDRREISNEKKTIFVAQAMETVFKEIQHLGVSRESIEHARGVANSVRSLVESKPDFLSVVKVLSEIPGDLLRHSMAVSCLSVMLASKMGWTMPATLEKLAMGALLHDIGLKELPKELIEKPRHLLSYEERLLYETHPFRGAEILRSMPSVSEELISIVYEHHENAIGQGYPRRMRDLRMNPLAKIVAFADAFCELTFLHIDNPNPKSPAEALAFIGSTMGQPYNKQTFMAMKDMLGGTAKTKAS